MPPKVASDFIVTVSQLQVPVLLYTVVTSVWAVAPGLILDAWQFEMSLLSSTWTLQPYGV